MSSSTAEQFVACSVPRLNEHASTITLYRYDLEKNGPVYLSVLLQPKAGSDHKDYRAPTPAEIDATWSSPMMDRTIFLSSACRVRSIKSLEEDQATAAVALTIASVPDSKNAPPEEKKIQEEVKAGRVSESLHGFYHTVRRFIIREKPVRPIEVPGVTQPEEVKKAEEVIEKIYYEGEELAIQRMQLPKDIRDKGGFENAAVSDDVVFVTTVSAYALSHFTEQMRVVLDEITQLFQSSTQVSLSETKDGQKPKPPGSAWQLVYNRTVVSQIQRLAAEQQDEKGEKVKKKLDFKTVALEASEKNRQLKKQGSLIAAGAQGSSTVGSLINKFKDFFKSAVRQLFELAERLAKKGVALIQYIASHPIMVLILEFLSTQFKRRICQQIAIHLGFVLVPGRPPEDLNRRLSEAMSNRDAFEKAIVTTIEAFVAGSIFDGIWETLVGFVGQLFTIIFAPLDALTGGMFRGVADALSQVVAFVLGILKDSFKEILRICIYLQPEPELMHLWTRRKSGSNDNGTLINVFHALDCARYIVPRVTN